MPYDRTDLTQQYFKGIQRLPVMTREEVFALWKEAKKGDEPSKKKIMEANLKLVIPIAKKYRRSNVEFLDLIEEGNLGLMHAIDKFEPSKGFRFSTYASYWIEQGIRRSIEEQSKTIRIPPHAWESLRKWFKAWDRLHGQLGRDPTITEMAKKTALTARQIKGILNAAEAAKEMGSLESPVGGDENLVLEEMLESKNEKTPEKTLILLKLHDELERAMAQISPRERQVLALRYGLKANDESNTLEDVGKILKLSRERVRQIETRALERLRRIVHRMGLAETITIDTDQHRQEKSKQVLRLSRGILWSKQGMPLGNRFKLR